MKSLRLLLVVVLAAVALNAAIPAASAADPADRDTLYLAIGGESEDGYDPTLGWGRYGSPLFQSTLLRRDEDLNVVNDLAEDVSLSDDGLVWTAKIREDAKFSDGEPVTAADVAFTFNQALQSGGVVDMTALDSAVTTGDFTVEIRLKHPQSTFVNRLVSLGIVPQHLYDENYARNPIGSGPYKLVRWDEGQQLIVEANPYFYGEKPSISRLVFLFMDEDTAFAAAQAGQVQVVAVPQALAIQEVAGMTLHPVQSVDNRGIMFPMEPNTGKIAADGYTIGNDVTADRAIRQAINYAIDRQALVDGVLEGFGSVAHSPVSALPWDEPAAVIKDADPEKARQILADGGWTDTDGDGVVEKGGLRAQFTLVYPAGDATRQALALAVTDMVAEIGIQIDVQGKSWDDIYTLMHSDPVLFGWGSHDQTEMYDLYCSSMAGVEAYNAGFYNSPTVDAYLDQAMAALTEADAIPFWKKAQWDGETGFTTQGDAAWAWLVNLTHTYFVDNCLDVGTSQVEPHGHGWPITANIASWKWTCDK